MVGGVIRDPTEKGFVIQKSVLVEFITGIIIGRSGWERSDARYIRVRQV